MTVAHQNSVHIYQLKKFNIHPIRFFHASFYIMDCQNYFFKIKAKEKKKIDFSIYINIL